MYSFHNLPIDNFLDCLCDGNYSRLCIDKQVPTLVLISHWNEIYDQFLDGMKDTEGQHKLKLLAKINYLEFNYELIQLCIKRLSIGYSQNAIDCLKQIIRIPELFDTDKPTEYFQNLQIVITRSNGIRVQIGNLKAEYNLIEAQNKGEAVTRDNFLALISAVSRYVKFYIDRSKVAISEFVDHFNAMKAEQAAVLAKVKKR